ncbi:hypothetical protein Tco_0768244 [Tanacetum coccineum]
MDTTYRGFLGAQIRRIFLFANIVHFQAYRSLKCLRLSSDMLGSELQGEDFAKKMVDLVNQRKKFFAEERAKAKRNKPMTQSQLKT